MGRGTGQTDTEEEGRWKAEGHLLACGNAAPHFNPQSKNFGDQEAPRLHRILARAHTSSQEAGAVCCTSEKYIAKQL